MEKLQKWSPIGLLLLLAANIYLFVVLHNVERDAKNASWSAHNAYNSAANAGNRCANLLAGRLNQIQLQCSSCSSAASRCRGSLASDPVFRQYYRMMGFSNNYHEVLLEDLAVKLKVDLKNTRETAVRVSKRLGYTKPRGWVWVR